MKKFIAIFLIISLFISGCSHSILPSKTESKIQFYDRISSLCKDKNQLRVETVTGNIYHAKEITISTDSTTVKLLESENTIVLSTTLIHTISFSDAEKGALKGMFSGLWIGAGVGLLLGQIKLGGGSGQIGRIYYLLYSTLIGSIIGVIYGLSNSSTTTITIN